MENSTFKLVLSHQGKEFLSTLLQGRKENITFYIALGESSQLSSPEDITLFDEKNRVQASLAEEDSKVQGLHLSALFSAANSLDEEFDVHEIGVILELENGSSIFLGRHASEKVISRKNNLVDFFVDLIIELSAKETENLIINAKDYQTNFAIMHASDKNYGTVRLANDKDIENKQSNAVLTTNVMHYFSGDKWSVLESCKISVQEVINPNQTDFICSAHFINEKQIRILFVTTHGHIDHFVSQDIGNDHLYSLIYHLDGKGNNQATLHSILSGKIPKQSIEACQYLPNEKSCYIIYHEKQSDPQLTQLIFSTGPSKEDLNKENITIDDGKKNLIKINSNNFLYVENENNKIIKSTIINIESTSMLTILQKDKDSFLQKESLLAHIVGDKVYTLEKSPLSAVIFFNLAMPEIFFYKSMLPLPKSENWGNISSCVMGNAIYIFMINQFEKNYTGKLYYYRYDCADNTWTKKTIPNSIQINSDGLTGKVMSFGGVIYLFLMDVKDKSKELSIHVRKLIVRN